MYHKNSACDQSYRIHVRTIRYCTIFSVGSCTFTPTPGKSVPKRRHSSTSPPGADIEQLPKAFSPRGLPCQCPQGGIGHDDVELQAQGLGNQRHNKVQNSNIGVEIGTFEWTPPAHLQAVHECDELCDPVLRFKRRRTLQMEF